MNIRCILAHLTELEYHLDLHRPHVVMIQETWLDDSAEKIEVRNYSVVSRRDRKKTASRAGVLTLQRNDFNGMVLIKNCEKSNAAGIF